MRGSHHLLNPPIIPPGHLGEGHHHWPSQSEDVDNLHPDVSRYGEQGPKALPICYSELAKWGAGAGIIHPLQVLRSPHRSPICQQSTDIHVIKDQSEPGYSPPLCAYKLTQGSQGSPGLGGQVCNYGSTTGLLINDKSQVLEL